MFFRTFLLMIASLFVVDICFASEESQVKRALGSMEISPYTERIRNRDEDRTVINGLFQFVESDLKGQSQRIEDSCSLPENITRQIDVAPMLEYLAAQSEQSELLGDDDKSYKLISDIKFVSGVLTTRLRPIIGKIVDIGDNIEYKVVDVRLCKKKPTSALVEYSLLEQGEGFPNEDIFPFEL